MTVAVTAVNDAPSFAPGGNVTVNEDSAPAPTHRPGRPGSSTGPADEAGQTVAFTVTTHPNAALFRGPPPRSTQSGGLTFTPAANAHAPRPLPSPSRHTGGTANGGADTSASSTFTITVKPGERRPVRHRQHRPRPTRDTAYVFTAGDFGFSDADGNGLEAVRITTLPIAGGLTLDGNAVSAR